MKQYLFFFKFQFQPTTNRGLLKTLLEDVVADSNNNWVFKSMHEEDEIDPVPEDIPLDPQEFWETMEKWVNFRLTSLVVRAWRTYNNPNLEGKEKEIELTSLYPYYATLPKLVREH